MAKTEVDQDEVVTYSAKQLAQKANTDPKTFRRFLREHLRSQDIETPGQGGRYNFTKSEGKALVKAFGAWASPKVKAPKATGEVEDITELDEAEVSDLVAALEASIAQAEGDAPTGPAQDPEDEDDIEDDSDEDTDSDEDEDDLVDLAGPDEDELEDIELEA